jgi:sirohydrochlorin cobaltochelatase
VSNPLLVVGHGTKDDEGVAQFHELLDRLRESQDRQVEGGFLELSSPPIQDAVAKLPDGVVDVVPLVLVAAGHSKGDIPAALERERQRHPGITFRYGRPLGPHPLLLEDLTARLEQAGPLSPDLAVVLVGRGATDPDANAEVAKTARLLLEGREIGTVETAFVSLAEPSVSQGLERADRLGYKQIVVLPYFLFEGVLPERIRTQTAKWADGRQATVTVAGLIGPSANLAQLVVERAAELAEGDIRMNCDTCMYRTLMPGFENRLGQPQTPHDHPDDPAHHHH